MSEIEYLREELFCTKYELDSFAEITLNGKAERWVPSFTGSTKDDDHLGRYDLVCAYAAGLDVLDIACGAGKGSKLLATKGNAAKVLGADINSDAVRYAAHRYAHPNLSFEEMDGLALGASEDFDMVVSFETIEHISAYQKFVRNIWNALRPNGVFIVSTPISKDPLDLKPANPYHTQEWGFNEFHDILTLEGFGIEKIFVQLDLILPGPTLVQRIWKRLFNKKKNIRHFTGYLNKRIEEFTGQYPVREFGRTRNGFQIVVCRKGKV